MRVYLTMAPSLMQYLPEDKIQQKNILISYYNIREDKKHFVDPSSVKSFMLDSGAFTFIRKPHKGRIDWDVYIEEYAAFITRWKVSHFFELDIGPLVGLKEEERLRAKLERLTGKQSIPVWHVYQGRKYFERMCDEYSYVAFGGLQTDGLSKPTVEKLMPWSIWMAHSRGTKIHGLGYTDSAGLHKFHFDSVDSLSWAYGNKCGFLCRFDERNGVITRIEIDKQRKRLKTKEAMSHNFEEWSKFVEYAEKVL